MQTLTIPPLPSRNRVLLNVAKQVEQVAPELRRTLLIDPRDTLFDATVGRRWLYQQLSFREQSILPYAEFYQAWDQILGQEVYLGNRAYWEAVHQFLRAQNLTIGHADELTRAARTRFPELEAGGKLQTVVVPILSVLASYGIRSVAVVNASMGGEDFQAIYFPPGCDIHFDAVYSSIDLSTTKDQAEALARLRDQLGEWTWGQRPYLISACETTRRAAQSAGLRTLAISHSNPSEAVDHHLSTWADLIPFYASNAG